jgi:hypothetical protein
MLITDQLLVKTLNSRSVSLFRSFVILIEAKNQIFSELHSNLIVNRLILLLTPSLEGKLK